MTGSNSTHAGDTDSEESGRSERDAVQPDSPTRYRSIGQIASLQAARQVLLTGTLALILFVGPAVAQSEVGTTLCGTPIANFINGVVPLVVSLAMIVGAVLAAFMHARSGVARDAEQARFYMDWRNRAGYTAVTAPLLAFIIQMLIGFTGTGVASCINLVPFF